MKNNFKVIRHKRGLTQVEVANKANITGRMYQYYEAGTNIPLATTAIDIAKALDTTVEKLFGSTEDESGKEEGA